MGSDQGLARHIGTHAAIAQDEVGQDRTDRLARGALDAPDGEPAQAHPSIMGVTGQTPAAGTGRLMGKLEADQEHKGEDQLHERLAIAEQLKISGFVVRIDGDGAVLADRFGGRSHALPSIEMAVGTDEPS